MALHTIHTQRTRLRQFTLGDIAGVRALMTDGDVMKLTGFREPQSEERIQTHLAKWCAAAEAPLGVWCIEELDSDTFVGWCMLRPTPEADPELGFMFPKSQWNQGYATEVSAALLEHAFLTLGLERVTVVASAENAASIRVLNKIGMTAVPATDNTSSARHFEITAA